MNEKKCPTGFFKLALAAVIDGVQQLNRIGVPHNEAAALVGRLWTDSCNEASAALYQPPINFGGSPPPATDKPAAVKEVKEGAADEGKAEETEPAVEKPAKPAKPKANH